MAESKKIEGPYTFKGILIKSEANALNGANAIDPALEYGRDGKLYMAYGSFFGGIFINEIDIETGLIKNMLEPSIRIAGSRGAAIEGAHIAYVPESDYFYLFVSYGSLSKDYNIRVGRAREITGPYLDANGNNMAALGLGNEKDVGVKLMGGYKFLSTPGVPVSKRYMAPGHNGVLVEDSDYFIAHHVRTYSLPEYWFYMNIRQFYINAFGWPVVAPNRYYGEKLEKIDLPEAEYEMVSHLSDSNSESRDSVKIELSQGLVSGAFTGSYRLYDDYRIEIILEDILYDGVVLNQYDWERDTYVTAFTAMSEGGLCIWAVTGYQVSGG